MNPTGSSPDVGPAGRRTRVKRVLAGVFGSILLLAGAVWFELTQPLFTATPSPSSTCSVDSARLRTHVTFLAETVFPRNHLRVDNLDRAAQYVRDEFAASGARVTEQEYSTRGHLYRNVIAGFGPASGDRVVVGAHYDSCRETPGADDNASGVAGLLELARILRDARLSSPVELVAYTLEEPPHFRSSDMGSARHAMSLKEHGVRLRAMISLEMIGFFSDEAHSQAYPSSALALFYPTTGDFAAVVGKMGDERLVRTVKAAMRSATDLPIYSITAPTIIPGLDWSDHRSYWRQGYPAVMVTDTAFYRNARYHGAEDRPGTLDYERMAKVVVGVRSAVLALANE